jgi:hypothetical protein
VAIHKRWVSEDEAARVLAESLRRTRFWGWSSGDRVVIGADDAEAVILSATDQLIEQAKRGHHTPAYPIGRSYLRLLTRKDMAALADRSSGRQPSLPSDALGDKEADLQGDRPRRHRGLPAPGTTSLLDGTPANQPEASPWSERHLRRVTARLAQKDGHPSLTLLTREERHGYEARAIEELRERHRPRELRQSIREVLAQGGVTLTPEAIQQFVARHRDEPPAELMRSVSRYLERPRRRSGKPSP